MSVLAEKALFLGFLLPVSLKKVDSLRSETGIFSETMASTKEDLRHVAALLWTAFGELGDFECRWGARQDEGSADFAMIGPTGQEFVFNVKVRERVTPQMADDLFSRIHATDLAPHVVRLVYAPVISPRVAEIARRYDVSYLDHAGNCHIVNPAVGLFISRAGIPNKSASRNKGTVTDLFSPKSSRIIRAMLHRPDHEWQVSELAEHPDVDVSAGLVSKVKRTLISENYAAVRNRLLYLKEPRELLNAWAKRYPGAANQRQYYMRGDTQEIEARVSSWCEESSIEYALARFSAAWRHAPEVRYSVASAYVGAEAFRKSSQISLKTDCGARKVDSGANLVLLTPFDQSVFTQKQKAPEQMTSPLQTWLDLQAITGRGEEAAEAVFDKHLRKSLEFRDDHQEGE